MLGIVLRHSPCQDSPVGLRPSRCHGFLWRHRCFLDKTQLFYGTESIREDAKSGCETPRDVIQRGSRRSFNSCTRSSRYREGYFIISAPRRQKLNHFYYRSQLLTFVGKQGTTFHHVSALYLLQNLSPNTPPPPKTMPRGHGRGTFTTAGENLAQTGKRTRQPPSFPPNFRRSPQ